MSNDKNLLDHFAKINAGFLHAYGEAGTEKLLQLIEFNNGESVLEIGFGTGTTLVKIAAEHKQVKLYGIERSETMLKKAKARIRFANLQNNISLIRLETGQQSPFANNFFDKIIVESVLAIQDDKSLHFMLSEIQRVLKPSGKFYLNETVWLSSITQEEIEKINAYCKNKFGIIQSNGTYKDREGWKQLFETNKFNVLELRPLKDIELKNKEHTLNTNEFLSKVYSVYGKIRGKLNAELKKESLFYKGAMKSIFEDKQYLEGIIFVATKR